MPYETLTGILLANRDIPRAIHYHGGGYQRSAVSFAQLHARSLGILWHFQRFGIRPGDRMILLLGQNEHFVDCFWAMIAGGVIPAPLAVGVTDEHRRKVLRAARRLDDPFLCTDSATLDRLGAFAAADGEGETFQRLRRRCVLIDSLTDLSQPGRVAPRSGEDIAVIQFSSGSTSEPKGVVITHSNVIANLTDVTRTARLGEDDVSLSWLPLTHDLGLIGKHIFMFANRMNAHFLATESFIRSPLRWAHIASEVGATLLSSPNFGLRHFLNAKRNRSLAGVDLSAVRLIFNGAEPISPSLCDGFMEDMAPYGLRRSAMFPVYGLAEATLAVAFPPAEEPYKAASLNRRRLGVGDRVEQVAADNGEAVALMNVGRPLPSLSLRVASIQGDEVPDRVVGHLLIRGANVTQGYYASGQDAAPTSPPTEWLDTGDIGVLIDGDLYVTGRAKEIIFHNGQNYYPHDLEEVAQELEGLDAGKLAAAGLRLTQDEVDELIMFVQHRGPLETFASIAAQIRRRISARVGLTVAYVVPVGRIPKTTSGKIQRMALAQAFMDGEFAADMAKLAELQAAYPAGRLPENEIERELQMVVENEMSGRPVDLDENLIESGADSLTMNTIYERLNERFPAMVLLTDLFDNPSIAQLARLIEAQLQEEADERIDDN